MRDHDARPGDAGAAAQLHAAFPLRNMPDYGGVVGETHVRVGHQGRLLSMVGPEQLRRILLPMLSDEEILSP